MDNCLLIFLGGGIGCLLRYWASTGAYALLGHNFPYGTMLVNVTGSFLMGLLFAVILNRFNNASPQLRAFLLIGFLGGYTTFSSFSIETFNLFAQGEMYKAVFNACLSVALCIASVWFGIILGRQV